MSKNDITGDRLVSRPNSKAFDEGMARIFGVECAPCHGSGGVQYEDSDGHVQSEQCPYCHGVGKVLE